MRGDYDAAEQAYRLASQRGREPQPGLALMRLAQGKSDSAVAAIRRVVGESTVPLARAGLLPAYVEIMLAIGSLDLARAACRELDEISQRFGGEVLQAMSAHSMGTLALAEGRPSDALTELRRALGIWAELGALYEVARIRVRVGLACRALEDEDAAALELLAARNTFAALGAAPDCAWVDSLAREASPDQAHGLTAREPASAPARGGRENQPRHRTRAVHQRAHRCPPRAEHLS
jgi:tetratricopeptide (TPR) repeat protein